MVCIDSLDPPTIDRPAAISSFGPRGFTPTPPPPSAATCRKWTGNRDTRAAPPVKLRACPRYLYQHRKLNDAAAKARSSAKPKTQADAGWYESDDC